MGSLFGKKKESPRPVRSQPQKSAAPAEKMRAPDVEMGEVLPPEAAARIDEVVAAQARGLLVDPEDEESRFFAFFDDRLDELVRVPVDQHEGWLIKLNEASGGAFSSGGARYQLQTSQSLSDFGDRLTVAFFEEGKFDTDGLIERRRENIRCINRLKPATSLTRKNIEDILSVVERNPRDADLAKILLDDQMITEEQFQAIQETDNPLRTLFERQTFPRKAAASALARYLGVDYIDVEAVTLDKKAARSLDKDWSLKKQVVVYAVSQGVKKVAMMDPTDKELVAELEQRLGEVTPYLSAAQDIMVVIGKAHQID